MKDIRGRAPEEVYEELRGPGDASGRVIIEFRTENNPKIFDKIWSDPQYDPVRNDWYYPYTGTGFIASKDGEILPEYYIEAFVENDKVYQDTGVLGIKLIRENSNHLEIYSIGW